MSKISIATLTINPAIDSSCDAEVVRHTHKTRTFNERMDPGGGGINVARVLKRFGMDVQAILLAGGVTGKVLDDLLERMELSRLLLPVAGDTRMSLAVHERSSGLEYRFVPEGPEIVESEWQSALEAAGKVECDYLVASGSLARGVPEDFYARLRVALSDRDVQLVLDTSGAALKEALDAGGLCLIKPSRGELERLVGRPLATPGEVAGVASDIVAKRQARHVAVTLGREGAVLVDGDGARFLAAVQVETRSAVGAGDSFTAAMTFGFATGLDADSAFRLATAAGAAAVLHPGTGLCRPEDVQRLLDQVGQPQAIT